MTLLLVHATSVSLPFVWGLLGFWLLVVGMAELSREELLSELESTKNDLKTAQDQLIQSKKMASLGLLTAGIAHEIKNPLNFVNNFSVILSELVDEIEDELRQNSESPVSEILDDMSDLFADVKVTASKIREHGKRADGIVKTMLQHSRGAEGLRLPTNINELLKEYVNLSYHGLRANDPEFNSDYEIELDENVGKVEVMPQEMGRVFLNLLNNAFYAVNHRAKKESREFDPVVRVKTEKLEGKIRVTVSDNGGGVPADKVESIFQPFFTTKPTGDGTGLGLSMSREIVSEGHGGTLTLENRVGDGATFVIELPV